MLLLFRRSDYVNVTDPGRKGAVTWYDGRPAMASVVWTPERGRITRLRVMPAELEDEYRSISAQVKALCDRQHELADEAWRRADPVTVTALRAAAATS